MNKHLFMVGLVATLVTLAPAYLSTANAATTISQSAITVQPGQSYFVAPDAIVTADSLTNNGGNVFVQGQLYIKGDLVNQNGGIIIVSNKMNVEGTTTNAAGSTIRTDSGAFTSLNAVTNNYGRLDNFGDLSGAVMNLTNYGTLNNYGHVGTMGITVTVANGGLYNNAGTYQGTDYAFLRVNAGGVLNNTGTVINSAGNLVNDGTINNKGQLSIHKQTYGDSVLENHAQATINNSANILIEGGANFINSGTLTGNPAVIQSAPQSDASPQPVTQPVGCPDPTQECDSPP